MRNWGEKTGGWDEYLADDSHGTYHALKTQVTGKQFVLAVYLAFKMKITELVAMLLRKRNYSIFDGFSKNNEKKFFVWLFWPQKPPALYPQQSTISVVFKKKLLQQWHCLLFIKPSLYRKAGKRTTNLIHLQKMKNKYFCVIFSSINLPALSLQQSNSSIVK